MSIKNKIRRVSEAARAKYDSMKKAPTASPSPTTNRVRVYKNATGVYTKNANGKRVYKSFTTNAAPNNKKNINEKKNNLNEMKRKEMKNFNKNN